MNSITKSLFIILGFLLLTLPTQAESISESAYLLKEAMMQSNADYNKHKKIENYEEFDRADEWGEREVKAISINNSRSSHTRQISDAEFKELTKEFQVSEREVSSNDSE